MTNQEIKSKLNEVFSKFIDGLYHNSTKELLKGKLFFAGGCIRDLLRGKEPKDYDLYFYDEEAKNKFLEIVGSEFQFKTTSIGNYNSKKIPVQIITIVAGMPEELVDTFDFTINQGFYSPQLGVLKLGESSNTLLPGKNIYTPLQALLRAQKFLQQGYSLPAATIIDIGVQISKKKIATPDDLKEALMGMSYSEVFDGAPEVFNQINTNFESDNIPF